ncbi:MAG: ABC transporter ATP-binding protein [Anaerolineales bacterium]|nr:ABC transporter ATP-binding protein [Anaerolineales bacterium]MCX7756311.1 ABC transporter ATP-binding protein [Anaerolineales bacterium]MDW8278529.1 ABC transporter ATP-binding protein [Anaerolineales bacterium]
MIECEDLTKHFETFKAVEGVTLTVRPGQVLALLGQNGAGKTTTIRMLTSVLRPTRGWARVAGYDVVKQAGQVRASVGVLTEMHGLYGRMTAEEYLDFFGQVYDLDPMRRKRRTEELLEYFGLTHAARRRSGEYSKGMRQKLALARALIHEPPVLLLDEPTSAMDPESAQLVRHEIARLRSSHRSIIICTHNLTEAEMLADHIAIIYKGRIVIQGTLDELRRQLLGPEEYLVQLSGGWRPEAIRWPQGARLVRAEENGFVYQSENPATDNPLIIRQLIEQQAQVISVQGVPHTLEMIYLEAMSQAAKGNL